MLDCLSDWMEAYEQLRVPMPAHSPAQALKLLMSANGLRQTDLAVELGGQPVVSAVLRGKRKINAQQALRLAKRFNVSAMLFLSDAGTSSVTPTSQRQYPA
ncbi:helix-turn-helix domain-containing protein [Roseateles amylovorans]|uniref:Helix-turn-helix domain-containing protein n=1 Tax=Roseateles amylovorans TaxID=2978473 RepID=A0ABY6AW16_9BURK|nr:helix-turn-helix domain-containing protein [Roseateles amylovorans]UXH77366.1 helix-turn-helix domain-containing protein [Roseateles amylovorans]